MNNCISEYQAHCKETLPRSCGNLRKEDCWKEKATGQVFVVHWNARVSCQRRRKRRQEPWIY